MSSEWGFSSNKAVVSVNTLRLVENPLIARELELSSFPLSMFLFFF